MKNNRNPLFESNLPLAWDPFGLTDPNASAPENMVRAGIGYTIGAGSKYLKDRRMCDRIVSEFPDPMKLREYLYSMNSVQARQIAQRITPNMDINQYRKLIHVYILKGNLLRYLIHAWGHGNSAILNAADAATNEFNTTRDVIRKNVN